MIFPPAFPSQSSLLSLLGCNHTQNVSTASANILNPRTSRVHKFEDQIRPHRRFRPLIVSQMVNSSCGLQIGLPVQPDSVSNFRNSLDEPTPSHRTIPHEQLGFNDLLTPQEQLHANE